MRGIWVRAAAFACAFVCVSALCCFSAGANAGERQSLHVYTWSDYFDSEVISQFQEKYDCDVVLNFFDSNENLHKTLMLDVGSFDVLTPSTYMAAVLWRDGFLAGLDHSLLPNLRHLAPEAVDLGDDPDMVYSIPYARTVTGVGYDRTRVPESERGSWAIFDSTALPGKTAFLSDAREALGAALKYLGHSLNTVDPGEIAEAGDVLRRWRRNIELFDVDGAKAGLIDGRYAYAQHYNGDVFQAMETDPDLDFFIPREGTAVSADSFAVSEYSPVKDLAHAFINHMLDPGVARRTMETVLYYMPNANALAMLPAKIRDSHAFSVPPEILEKSEVIRAVSAEVNDIYEKVWEEARK